MFYDDKPSLEDVIAHYGVGKMDGAPGRGSGRYPLGSGDNLSLIHIYNLG